MFARNFLWAAAVLPTAAFSAVAPPVPLGFEQVGDAFVAHAMGTAIQVSAAGAAIQFQNTTIRMRLVDASGHPTLVGQGNADTENRFIGNDPARWQRGIPLFRRVGITDAYPGIALAYYGSGARLEYDFTVAPHANPNRIQLVVEGAGPLRLDPVGDLVGGGIVQQRPVAYQIIGNARHEVASRFVLNGKNQVGFAIGPYDHSAPLTVDPIIDYASYLGGTATDEAHAVAVDAQGNFYIAGRTFSTTHSNSNVLLLKVTPTGSSVHSIFGGTTGNDSANAVVVDSTGNVYLAGGTSSSDFPVSGEYAAYQSTLEGAMNAFVMALNASNTVLIFSTYFGGNYSDQALAMAIGPNNNLYIAGDTTSSTLTVLSSTAFQAFNASGAGGYDAFVASFTYQGVPNFGTFLGGSGDDHAYGIAVDASGDSYVVGTTASTNFPVSPYPGFLEPFQLTNHGTANAFAIELLPNGNEAAWSTYIGGSSNDAANAVALDSSGNVYIAGTAGSSDFPTLTGHYQTAYQGGASDGFVIVLQNNGQGLWGSFLGSAGDDVLNGIALDSSSDILVTGATDSTSFPITTDAVQAANAGGQDAIITELNNGGTELLFSTYFGGTGNDVATAITTAATGQIFIAGITASSDNSFPVTSGTFQTTYGGGSSDGFFAVFGCSSVIPTIGSGGVVNAASYVASAIAPGSIVSIFGTNLSCSPASASTLPLPTALGDVTVSINGEAMPLYYVGAGQINAQVPYDIAVGNAMLTVTGPAGTSAAASVPVIEAGPGVFALSGQALALNQDYTVNSATNPAKTGSYITLFFTGQGPLSQAVATGAANPLPPPLITVTLANSATIGGMNAPVDFMGAAPGLVGLGQANLTIPALATGSYPVVLTIGGVASQPVTVTVTQ